jgi:light-regulated signal transduction histidine kinase (bacteriophytochrome)
MSKTRFFAAASHDLLQPLNAARLFVSALESRARAHPEFQELASRIDASMRAAEELLDDLLDIARLDSGVLKPDITSFRSSICWRNCGGNTRRWRRRAICGFASWAAAKSCAAIAAAAADHSELSVECAALHQSAAAS